MPSSSSQRRRTALFPWLGALPLGYAPANGFLTRRTRKRQAQLITAAAIRTNCCSTTSRPPGRSATFSGSSPMRKAGWRSQSANHTSVSTSASGDATSTSAVTLAVQRTAPCGPPTRVASPRKGRDIGGHNHVCSLRAAADECARVWCDEGLRPGGLCRFCCRWRWLAKLSLLRLSLEKFVGDDSDMACIVLSA